MTYGSVSLTHVGFYNSVPCFLLSLYAKLFHSYLFDRHPTNLVDCLTQVRRGYRFSQEVHGLRNHLQQQQK